MKLRTKHIFFFILLLFLLTVLAAWSVWYFKPVTEEEAVASDVAVITETRYIVMADSVDVFAFSAPRGDTLLNDIVDVKHDILTKERSRVSAQWVRRWNLLPYSGGTLAVEAFDTAKVTSFSHDKVLALLRREAQHLNYLLQLADAQRKDIDYFTKTHTVTDNGFDIVSRYGEELTIAEDSVTRCVALVEKALCGKRLQIRLDRRYYLNSYLGQIECVATESNDSTLTLRMKPTERQEEVELEQGIGAHIAHSRFTAASSLARLIKRRPKPMSFFLTAVDSAGTYTGKRDSVNQPHGYGRFVSPQGEFYEGEWVHGKREGVGFTMIPGKRLLLGEWKADRFLGERITYTPERIYGIDISRFQHEDGRKRYNIDWRNLRITSLGKLSKKKIDGTVNYPVRFVYIKSTEGVTVKSNYYAADYVSARKYGYRTGAYHFFSISSSGAKQAEYFLKNSRYQRGDLPPVLDVEPTDAQIRRAGGIDAVFRNVRDWLRVVEQRRGVRPILYISQSFVNKYLSKAPDIKKKYEVWIARYGEYKPDVHLVYWQLSPDGRVNGIHGDVDINVYNGFSMN